MSLNIINKTSGICLCWCFVEFNVLPGFSCSLGCGCPHKLHLSLLFAPFLGVSPYFLKAGEGG